MKVSRLTGVTLMASMVPASFSPTMLSVGSVQHMSMMRMPISEGIMNSL